MANIRARYCALNLALTAILTVSPAVNASYPIENTIRQERTLLCRATSVATQEYRASWSANQSANFVALWLHNFSATATIRVQVYSDSAFTTPIADSGTVNAYAFTGWSPTVQHDGDEHRIFKMCTVYFAAVTTMRSIKITVIDTNNVFGWPEFSHLFIGKYVEFTHGYGYGGAPLTVMNATVNERGDDGSPSSDKGANWVRLDLSHDEIDEALDWEELIAAVTQAGGDGVIFISVFPTLGTSYEARYQHLTKTMAQSAFDPYLFQTTRTRMVLEGL